MVEEVLGRCEQAWALTDGWFDPWAVPDGFDPSALVKGWSLEQVGRLLAPACAGFLVDAGGDLLVRGRPEPGRSWSVGVRHPLEGDALAAVLAVDARPGSGTAVATSGTYARGDHVIDPRTGAPGAGLLSATVVGPDPGLADALATAVFVEGLDGIDRIVGLPGYEALPRRPPPPDLGHAGSVLRRRCLTPRSRRVRQLCGCSCRAASATDPDSDG